jgi:hypothetical protein
LSEIHFHLPVNILSCTQISKHNLITVVYTMKSENLPLFSEEKMIEPLTFMILTSFQNKFSRYLMVWFGQKLKNEINWILGTLYSEYILQFWILLNPHGFFLIWGWSFILLWHFKEWSDVISLKLNKCWLSA